MPLSSEVGGVTGADLIRLRLPGATYDIYADGRRRHILYFHEDDGCSHSGWADFSDALVKWRMVAPLRVTVFTEPPLLLDFLDLDLRKFLTIPGACRGIARGKCLSSLCRGPAAELSKRAVLRSRWWRDYVDPPDPASARRKRPEPKGEESSSDSEEEDGGILKAAWRRAVALRGMVCHCCGTAHAPTAVYTAHVEGCEAALRGCLQRLLLPLSVYLPRPPAVPLPQNGGELEDFNKEALSEHSRAFVPCEGCGELFHATDLSGHR
eukprot:Hpha_TRINITY_DN31408_c0_g1::TRINITY_DN31408_c0_g1_i1::g.145308::m.145308